MALSNIKCLSLTLIGVFLAGTILSLSANASEVVSLSSLDLSKVRQDWAKPQTDKSVDGHPLSIGGRKFEQGLGTHSVSTLYIDLKGDAERFTAFVGIDDEVGNRPQSSVEFRVVGDGRDLWKSDVMIAKQPPKKIDVNLKGVKTLLLMVDDTGNGIAFDHADWADAKIEFTGDPPETMAAPPEEPVILTPPPPDTPRINGAKVFGVRPGSLFLFTMPATGRRPIQFAAENLPNGLTVDSSTGSITGRIEKRGEYIVMLSAKNNLGQNQRELKIICSETIALTPPMGWSTWNCFGYTVDDAKVRAAADAMVQSGLINHGWTYINLDSGFMPQSNNADPVFSDNQRDENDMLIPDKKFPDMKALCDYIHDKGLKAGIYSPRTRYQGPDMSEAYRQQEKDIQLFAKWGFDYYKFNWTSYIALNRDRGLPGLQEAYKMINSALNKTNRDMVLSVTGTGLFVQMGNDIGGNCWLSTTNITDTWSSISRNGFAQAESNKIVTPGHWNNADALLVGVIGRDEPRPTKLTPNEQYTHISLWCLLGSPLLIGCDLTNLDEFTLNLLANDEVLEVNQDPLGKQARRVSKVQELEVWAKELEDGLLAVGLFNRGESENKVTATWSDLGISGKQIVRDLWRQKDLGEYEDRFTATVDRHGVVLVRLRPSGK